MLLADSYIILLLLVIMSYVSIFTKVVYQRYFRPLQLYEIRCWRESYDSLDIMAKYQLRRL